MNEKTSSLLQQYTLALFIAKKKILNNKSNTKSYNKTVIDFNFDLHYWIIAMISANIVSSWDIEGCELASVRRYPNEGQYSPISVQ